MNELVLCLQAHVDSKVQAQILTDKQGIFQMKKVFFCGAVPTTYINQYPLKTSILYMWSALQLVFVNIFVFLVRVNDA